MLNMEKTRYVSGAHAVVFGASGLTGWGVVDQLLRNYPNEGAFVKVTALVNRPLKVEETYWPVDPESTSQPALNLVSGINLARGTVNEFAESLQRKVSDIGSVTHAFYFAYKQNDDPVIEFEENGAMAERAIGALDKLCPGLKFVAFPTGTKAYGIHCKERPFTPPYKESDGKIPEPDASRLVYYSLHNVLSELSKDKAWTWCDVRPDIVVGFAPHGSTYNLIAHWATYLSLYARVEGKGAKVPYPGGPESYDCLYTQGSSAIMARFVIWASLNPDKAGGGEIFNISDRETPTNMAEQWPKFAKYFGLEGVGPSNNPDILSPSKYVEKHSKVLEELGVRSSDVWKSEIMDDFFGYFLTFDRHMSIEKLHTAGFHEEVDPTASWFNAFDQMKEAGMILV